MTLPKSHFPSKEHNPRAVFAAIRDELMLDGHSRQNLAAFCQTWVEDEMHALMDLCIDKKIEARCARMVADLWNAPSIEGAIGCPTTGSSEAAMLGGLAMKRRWEAQRQRQGKPIDRPNLVTGPVQICWHKFCRYWDIEHHRRRAHPGGHPHRPGHHRATHPGAPWPQPGALGVPPLIAVQAASTSATDQAWAMQPRGAWGASPSKISLRLPSPAAPR